MAKGKGGGAGAWAERWDKGEGAMGWVGPWVKGGKGLGHGEDSDITQKYS